MSDIKLDTEQTAATCYRAWHAAMHLQTQLWELIALDIQAPWLRMAKRCEEVLTAMEGQGYSRAGAELARLYTEDNDVLIALYDTAPRAKLAWQAVARHLMTLIDSDEVENLEALEQSWGPWTESRRSSS